MTKREYFELAGHPVLELVVFSQPQQVKLFLPDACSFLAVLEGNFTLAGDGETMTAKKGNCYFVPNGTIPENEVVHTDAPLQKAMLFHFTPAVLREAFHPVIPAGLFQHVGQNLRVECYPNVPHLHQFVAGTTAYFDHPEWVTIDLVKLKVRELAILLNKLH